VSYFCPPRFSDKLVGNIRKAAEVLFSFFEMRDFARLDGWLFDDGRILFSDFNPISGMEQNSFLFIQGSRVGLSHGDILSYIVQSAARRHNLPCPVSTVSKEPTAQKINVLFGGETAERQVSLMSGTNVWLKLRHHPSYITTPYLLSLDGDVWKLPYSYTLQHTVEEVLFHCKDAERISQRLGALVPNIRKTLGAVPPSCDTTSLPEHMSLEALCQRSKKENAFVFLGLHGGFGEDGRAQSLLNSHDLAYNGPDETCSNLCADKNKTAQVITALDDPDLIASPKLCFALQDAKDDVEWAEDLWKNAVDQLHSNDLLIKPQNDGCSAGVVRLYCAADLATFMKAVLGGDKFLAPGSLSHQTSMIELSTKPNLFMIEPFVITDDVRVIGKELHHKARTNWIELTVGVLEKNGNYHALTPSITVAEGNVLSLEEKFQGGTGINLTPPPPAIMSHEQIDLVRAKTEKCAKALGIQGYSRLDLFFNTASNQTLLIEANTLPGLTAATVIYHQAFAENPPLSPKAFLELLVEEGLSRKEQSLQIKSA
jgi:D-alanine-D-alanine ligase-like ATP-grasp enzyme